MQKKREPAVDEQNQQRLTREAIEAGHLSSVEVWLYYSGLGGELESFEVDAYLHGLLAMRAVQRDILSHAVNEMAADLGLTYRAPYSRDETVPGDDGSTTEARRQEALKKLGVAGSFLLSDEQQEEARLEVLRLTQLLDSPPEERFDRITRQAQQEFGTSAAYLALIDSSRQFIKSASGFVSQDLPREDTFCNHTIRGLIPMIVTDALEDPRFRDNPQVIGPPHIRFYAGYPLRGPGGWAIGTLCVIDHQPRSFSAEQARILRDLAESARLEIVGDLRYAPR